jgi:TRAP-type C4-dicarboxylate transport system substrate-binding protein
MYGATLIRNDAWDRIPPETRTAMLDASARRGVAADAEVRRMNRESLEVMRKQGLTVVEVDPAPWYAAMQKGTSIVRGSVVPEAFYDELVAARETCRAARAAAAR